jgi:spore maturation protein CgeB
VVRRILESGFELHVYGDSWRRYPVKEGERLVIHEAVAPELLSEEMSKSKISLNVMSWHKAGMTERIIDIMMARSVCLTDETRYLKEHFSQMEDIAMFRLNELDELPAMIQRLLSDDVLRERITERAYEKVSEEHTWDARTEQLLQLMTAKEER